jgi:hypothetical protein
MAPVVEIRGAASTELANLGQIVRLSDIRRLGAWNRVGARTSSRGSAALARRHAMRAAVRRSVISRTQSVAVGELAHVDIAVSATALCARPVRTLRSCDAAELRILCAAA